MKKITISLFAIIIIATIIIFVVQDRFNAEKIIKTIEEQTGLKIELIDKNMWNFYPTISYRNSNANIKHNNNSLSIYNANIQINRSYWPLAPFLIKIKTPIINYEGMELRDAFMQIKYINNIVRIENFKGKIVEGNIQAKGDINLDDKKKFNFQGQFNNISLNTLLKQSQVARWNRVNIKLSSPSFNISGNLHKGGRWVNSLIGTSSITGSLYFTSTDEERFGAAFLSLLVEKIPNLTPISQSIDFLLLTYANIPSSINGNLTVKNGSIESDEILIINKKGKSILNGSYNFLKNNINGKIYFYKENEIFLETTLQGEIENPQILVAGKIFSDQEDQRPQDIMQLFKKGLNSFIEKILTNNE